MGVMDKFLNYMRLNDENEDDEFLDEDYLDDEVDEAPAPRKPLSRKAAPAPVDEEESYEKPVKKAAPAPKVTPIRTPVSRKIQQANGMELCVVKPNGFEDAREITETLNSNRSVVLNLEGIDVGEAQRILDFTSGSCFAISGNMKQISQFIFIVTPPSVNLSGDFQELFGTALGGPLYTDLQ